jgi:hypothetical protein
VGHQDDGEAAELEARQEQAELQPGLPEQGEQRHEPVLPVDVACQPAPSAAPDAAEAL